MPTLITLKNVSWSYSRSGSWALKDVSLEIGEGEFIAVMGASGAGKTTLCKLCNGIIPHAHEGILRGAVTVDGLDTAAVSVARLSRIVGMAFEDPETQLFTASVEDEAAFGLENLRTPPDEIRERVGRALSAAGLSGLEDCPPSALSGGQKQRLAIAAALAMANKALVLDDPVSRLDPAGAREVFSLLRNLRFAQGRDGVRMTVLMASHDSAGAAAFADRVCVLADGRLAACDTPENIFSDAALLEHSGIMPPEVSVLARLMREAGEQFPSFPLTHAQALAAVREWLREQGR